MKLKIKDYPLIREYNVFDKKLCKHIIGFFKKNKELHHAGQIGAHKIDKKVKDTTDLHLENHLDDDSLEILYKGLADSLAQYVSINAGLAELVSMQDEFYSFEYLLLKRYKKNEGFYIPHYDHQMIYIRDKMSPDTFVHISRMVAFVIYLNDIDDGGETYFPSLDIKIKPEAGKIVVFPTFWTHMHGAKKPISDDRYIITSFLSWRAMGDPKCPRDVRGKK